MLSAPQLQLFNGFFFVVFSVARFFRYHGTNQSCGLCVHLAWLHSTNGPRPMPRLAEAAVRALLRMGGSPQVL
jgi:hypothetical protein